MPRSIMPLSALLMLVLVAALIPSTSRAFTPDQQRFCTGDAFRLCGSELPSIDRIAACLRSRRADLSQDCRVALDR